MTDTKAWARTEVLPVVLHTRPALDMDEEQFFEFCQQNRDWRIERTAEGDLEIMPPTGYETSDRNSELNMQLRSWAKRDGTGVASDSSGGFVLPNGAIRSLDGAWVRRERLASLTTRQKRKYLPLCPDLVIELRSPTDPFPMIEAKMREYTDNGSRLGWLLDPESRQVHVYRPGKNVESLKNVSEISGEPELPGFNLDLRPIWDTGL